MITVLAIMIAIAGYLQFAGNNLEEDYLDLSAHFREDKSRYENRIRGCQEQICRIEANIRDGNHGLESYVHLEHLTRGTVESLVKRIEAGKRSRETGSVPVRIMWNF